MVILTPAPVISFSLLQKYVSKCSTSVKSSGDVSLLQGAVEWDQLAACGFWTAGLSARQPSLLCVSEPAQLSFCTQELSTKET